MVDFSKLVNPEEFPTLQINAQQQDFGASYEKLRAKLHGGIDDTDLVYKNPAAKGTFTFPSGKQLGFPEITDDASSKFAADLFKEYETIALNKAAVQKSVKTAIAAQYADTNAEKLKIKSAEDIAKLDGKDKAAAQKARDAKIADLTGFAAPEALKKEFAKVPKNMEKLDEAYKETATAATNSETQKLFAASRGIPTAKILMAAKDAHNKGDDKIALHYLRSLEAQLDSYENQAKGGPKGKANDKSKAFAEMKDIASDLIKQIGGEDKGGKLLLAAPQTPNLNTASRANAGKDTPLAF